MRKRGFRSRNKRALSPIFATMILAAIVIVFGSIAYYFANNLTTTTTNNYVSSLSNSQQAISERIGFEDVQYLSLPQTLKVYIINCGIANNVKIDSVFIYNSNNNIVGAPFSGNQISALKSIDGGSQIPSNSLNVGKEGYFTISVSLSPGSTYTIHLITKSGSSFDYDFTA